MKETDNLFNSCVEQAITAMDLENYDAMQRFMDRGERLLDLKLLTTQTKEIK